MFTAMSARERESSENISNNVILASLELDFEGVFGEEKDLALNTSCRGKISAQKISKGCMIDSTQKFLAKKKHSEVFNGTNNGVQLDFLRCIVALGTAEGPRVEAYWVLQVSVFKALLEDGAECDTAAVSLENEVAVWIWKAHDTRL